MKGKTALLLSLILALGYMLWAFKASLPEPGLSVSSRAVSAEELMSGADELPPPYIELLPGEKLDINSAPAERLELLPEIGEELAGEIVRFREEEGPFSSAEDILEVDGIGPKRYEAMKDWIITGED